MNIMLVPQMDSEYSPETLTNISLNYLIKNQWICCTYDSANLRFYLDPRISLPTEICEKILSKAQENGYIIQDSFLYIFEDTTRTRLQHVKISNSFISDAGLEILCGHPIVQLDISSCNNLTSRSLENINRLSAHLQSLIIGNSIQVIHETLAKDTFHKTKAKPIMLKAPNLRWFSIKELNVSVQSEYFDEFFKSMKNLQCLEVTMSYIEDMSIYLCYMTNLVSLNLYNTSCIQLVDSICSLKLLQHLDISQSNTYGQYRKPNFVLKKIIESLPNLQSLDISGTNLAGSGVQESEVISSSSVKAESLENECVNEYLEEAVPMSDIPGLQSRVNRPLEFLGLYNTEHEACYRHHIPAKKIAGDANEDQILTSARAYLHRPPILQKVLNDLFHVFRYETCSNLLAALDVVMMAMKTHPQEKHIQIAGSASLFYIVKGDEGPSFNIKIKRQIITALLNAMSAHQNDTTMLRNGCLTLIHFSIPKDVTFEYERLVSILLHIVSEEEQDDFVLRIGIYLLNSLACQVEGDQKELVGERGAIRKMLRLVDRRLSQRQCDEVMETAWSTMWNVTDETPINCQRFLDDNGMDLFLKCIKEFENKDELLRNMMGLLGNVAEVKELRPRLMRNAYIKVFSDLLDSTSDGIEVSYNAAGILSHIMSDGEEPWITNSITSVTREQVILRMTHAINRWELDTKRNINYRSFVPILRVLSVSHTPVAQFWAVWALTNLTLVYPEKYCELLAQEGGIEKLESLTERLDCGNINQLIRQTLDQCKRFQSGQAMDRS